MNEVIAVMNQAVDVGLKQKWERIVQRLRLEVGEDLYTSWFARMEPEECVHRRLTVSVPTRFLRNWIDTHYAAKLHQVSESELGALDGVQIKVRMHGVPVRPVEPPERKFARTPESPAAAASGAFVPGQTGHDRGSPLDGTQTFGTFITGNSNRLAHAAASRIAEAAPGAPVSFNPLFVHSAAGLGKTHLLNAVGWRIRERHPDRKVLFITAERFMYHFVHALRQRDTISFKDFFQSIDVLLIDDIQFLQGKSMTQEFYHTFNSLVDAKRQIVVAADVPPAQLDTIDQRMRSRLMGGLVVDIELPELDLRRQIIATRLAELSRRDPTLIVDSDVVEFIANKVTGGGRELEGAINRVVAHQQFTHAPLSVDLAANVLRDMGANPDQCRVRIDDILRIIGRHYNVPRTDLLSPRRARAIVVPRQVGMYLAKKLTPRSLPEIGRRFGGRDHSTVLHAVRKIEELIKTDDRVAREVTLLMRMIEQQ
ncbi:chromosomal replication initiator protein DnaA [soil metagenome]